MGSNEPTTTRAQWVVPTQRLLPGTSARNRGNSAKRGTKQAGAAAAASSISRQPSNGLMSQSVQDSSSIIIVNTYTSDDLTRQRLTQSEHIDHEQQSKSKNDDAICKTICVIVEQYLKELRELQKNINSARSKLVRETHHSSDASYLIAYSDSSRLQVRDEQTKAIETIKQLTSYLRELSTIKRDESAQVDSISEEIYEKLSNLRSTIIHTLNDFVLANSDIDIPIVDLDDAAGSGRDYDLCVEAQRSKSDICGMELSREAGDMHDGPPPPLESRVGASQSGEKKGDHQQQQLVKRPLAPRNTNHAPKKNAAPDTGRKVEVVDYDDKYKMMTIQDDYQLIELDKRKREIHKLERDTVELRNLFADFYNLVKMQGEHVDTIEENLVIAAHQIKEGKNLLQQKPMRGLTVLLPMTGCITGALIGGPIGFLLGGKLGGVTVICASSLLGFLSSFGAQKCIGLK